MLLSDGLWREHFGGDSAIVGRTVRIGGQAREVVGVTEPWFGMPDGRARAWVPFRLDPLRPAENDHWVGAIARLAPGVTLAQAQEEMDRLTERLPERFPEAYDDEFMEEYGFATRLVPLRSKVIGPIDRTLWTLLGAVGLLLLVALANLAGLFLVRSEARRRELAVRSALGAGNVRLLGESVTESALVGLSAGALGLVLALGALSVVSALAPASLPRIGEIRLGWTGLGVAVGTAVLSGVLAGLLPWLWSRPDLDALRAGGRGATSSRGWRRFRQVLVGAQVALAFVLVAGVGLALRSFNHLMSADPGFDADGVLTVQLFLPEARYGAFEQVVTFYGELSRRVEAIPSVERAGAIEVLPFQPVDGCWSTFPADAEVAPDTPVCIHVLGSAPGYFDALDVPLLAGRVPDWRDAEAGTGEIVVTESLAERYWPGQDPLGKGLRGYSWGGAPAYRVVGVVGDVHADGVDRPTEATAFLPIRPLRDTPLHWGPYWGVHRQMYLVVEVGGGEVEALVPAIREVLAQLDPDVVPGAFESLRGILARSPAVSRARLFSALLAGAAAIALFLSCVALYGVVAYFVRQRTREIGLRVALGADIRRIVSDVVTEAARVGGAGLLVGLVVAIAAGRALESLLFRVHPNDPLTLAGSLVLLALVVCVAALIPARRAVRIDPSEALRAE